MDLSNDDFIRTTEPRHYKAVQHLWDELLRRDEIYLDKYAGWDAVRDEAFYAEDELTEKDGKTVVTWVGNFKRKNPSENPPEAESDTGAVNLIKGVYQGGLANLKKQLES